MRIVITGATGFVGREIVRQARGRGWPLRLVVRGRRSARGLADQPGVELFPGNVLDAPSLAGAMAGANCVIHLVGIVIERRQNTFERAHTQVTRNVVAAAQAAGVKRFLQMSALGTRPAARSRYHQTKWAAEEIVRHSSLAWTIFRPSVIYGPQDKSINVLAKVLRRLPFVPVLGTGQTKVQPIAVEAVAQCVLSAIPNDATIGQTYDLCGPVAFTWDELYDKLLQFYGLRKPKLHLPLPLARCLAAGFENLLPQPPFTRDQLLMLAEDNRGDPQPAVRDFGFTQESFAQGLARSLK